jgi:hypothetical protein
VFALLHVFFVFFWVSTSVFHLVTGVKPGKQSNQRSVKRQDGGIVFVVVVSLLTFLVEEGRQAVVKVQRAVCAFRVAMILFLHRHSN